MSGLVRSPEFYTARDFSYVIPEDTHPGVLVDAKYDNWQPTSLADIFDVVYDLVSSIDTNPEHRQQLTGQIMEVILTESWWFRDSYYGCEPSFDPTRFMAIPSQLYQISYLDDEMNSADIDCKWVFNYTDRPLNVAELERLNKLMLMFGCTAGGNELNTLKNIVVIPHRNNLFLYADPSKFVLARGILSSDPRRTESNVAVGRRGLDELFGQLVGQYAGDDRRHIGAIALDMFRPTAPTLPKPISIRFEATQTEV